MNINIEFERGEAVVSVDENPGQRLTDVQISFERPDEPDWEKSLNPQNNGFMYHKLTGEYVLTVRGKMPTP